MANWVLMVTTGDATSNPDPNTLGTPNPFPTPFVTKQRVSSAWTSQAKKGLFPFDNLKRTELSSRLRLHFIPSGGAAVTYTATIWFYDKENATWSKPKSSPSVNYTGETIDYIDQPGDDPIFIQLSSISAGTIKIYADGAKCLVQ